MTKFWIRELYNVIKGVVKLIVYLDVLLIENFIVNLFLICITSDTMKIKLKVTNAILSAVFATSYVMVILIPKLNVFNAIYIKIPLVMVFMIIAFKKLDIGFILKSSAIYIIYSMILSGLCFFMGINNINIVESKNTLESFSYKYIIMSMMILYIFINRIINFIKDRYVVDNLIYSVEIFYKGKVKSFKGFLDTGNELREPATDLPVIIVERGALGDITLEDKERYMIPYEVVNGSKGRLQGFKPEYIKLYYNKDEKVSIKPIEAIICICDNSLSKGGEYSALLSRGIL